MDIRIEDLYERCAKCQGTGKLFTPGIPPVGPGMGTPSYDGSCPACGGATGKLTGNGRVLRTFVSLIQNHPGLQ
jgi:hypothetical protein